MKYFKEEEEDDGIPAVKEDVEEMTGSIKCTCVQDVSPHRYTIFQKTFGLVAHSS